MNKYLILLSLILTSCSTYDVESKCVNGKYYVKWCEKCVFMKEHGECLSE